MNWSLFWIVWCAAFATYDAVMFASTGEFLFLILLGVMVLCLAYWLVHYQTRRY
jgi:hypothetical protein